MHQYNARHNNKNELKFFNYLQIWCPYSFKINKVPYSISNIYNKNSYQSRSISPYYKSIIYKYSTEATLFIKTNPYAILNYPNGFASSPCMQSNTFAQCLSSSVWHNGLFLWKYAWFSSIGIGHEMYHSMYSDIFGEYWWPNWKTGIGKISGLSNSYHVLPSVLRQCNTSYANDGDDAFEIFSSAFEQSSKRSGFVSLVFGLKTLCW